MNHICSSIPNYHPCKGSGNLEESFVESSCLSSLNHDPPNTKDQSRYNMTKLHLKFIQTTLVAGDSEIWEHRFFEPLFPP